MNRRAGGVERVAVEACCRWEQESKASYPGIHLLLKSPTYTPDHRGRSSVTLRYVAPSIYHGESVLPKPNQRSTILEGRGSAVACA